MAVDERARRRLHERLDDVLGEQAADTLMAELGSLGREQLATRHDMELGFASLRTEIAELRGEVRGDIAELRGDMGREMATLRGELLEAIADQAQVTALQTRQLGMWMLGVMLTLAALAFGAASI